MGCRAFFSQIGSSVRIYGWRLLTVEEANANIMTEMKPKTFILCLLSVVSVLPVAFGADFGRYEIILKRRPFGAPPARSQTRVTPQKPTEDPFKSYRLVGITRGDENDVSVGIVNIGVKPAQSIFLGFGESDQDLTLVDADFELEGALIRKGQDEKWLYLGGGSPGGGSGGYSAPTALGSKKSSSASKGVKSYIDRMRARRAQRGGTRTTTIAPPKLKGEELKKHLQDYNMQLIRQAAKGEGGAPPLPIPLTPEQDKQLVDEGVLPAQ